MAAGSAPPIFKNRYVGTLAAPIPIIAIRICPIDYPTTYSALVRAANSTVAVPC